MKLDLLLNGLPISAKGGNLAVEVQGLAYDSRKVKPGDLFVAIRGSRDDGHRHIPEALAKGARALLLQEPPAEVSQVPWAIVPDTREALARIACRLFGDPSREVRLGGITGTNGKTTTAYLVEAILREAGREVGVIGTVNYRYCGRELTADNTTPESYELQRLLREMRSSGVTDVVMEVSSHALEQGRVRGCHFDVGVFTNLSREHLDYHGTLEAYLEAKALLFRRFLRESCKDPWAVYNREDPRVKEVAEGIKGLKRLGYGLKEGDIRALRWRTSLEGTEALLLTPEGEIEVSSSLVGPHNLLNIMAAVATALALEVPLEAAAKGVAQVKRVPGRMEKVWGEPAVFVDYAHTPDALEKALKGLRPLVRGRLIVVFGCGGERDRGKRPLMGEVASRLADLVVVTSDNPRGEDPLEIIEEIRSGLLPGRAHEIVPDRREAIRWALREASPQDAVLIAGKGHETYQIIGTSRRPFDDREEALRALRELKGWN